MNDLVLSGLRLVLLLALYLFFARVVWAVWTEVRVPALTPTSSTASPTGATSRIPRRQRVTELKVIEPKSLRGSRLELTSTPIVIGRSSDVDLPFADDTYLSNRHAQVWSAEGTAMVEDLGSTNGTRINGRRIESATAIVPGDRVQMGHVLVEATR
jgi:pSer/pThr/pTyr-binding forkhead associated (FHA) protein